jgi:hypothetical protein
MKSTCTLIAGLALLGSASALPAYATSDGARLLKRTEKEKRILGILPGFDAAAQRIDVSGAHAFVPPNFAAGDIRGPCPGLNALANHNYLPHNGVATIAQFIDATTTSEFFSSSLANLNLCTKNHTLILLQSLEWAPT